MQQLMKFFLHRNQDPKQRKEYVRMHDEVMESGGDVKIFSSMHVSGERKLIKEILVSFHLPPNSTQNLFLIISHLTELAQLTGIAAILRFPMPELEEDSSEENDD